MTEYISSLPQKKRMRTTTLEWIIPLAGVFCALAGMQYFTVSHLGIRFDSDTPYGFLLSKCGDRSLFLLGIPGAIALFYALRCLIEIGNRAMRQWGFFSALLFLATPAVLNLIRKPAPELFLLAAALGMARLIFRFYENDNLKRLILPGIWFVLFTFLFFSAFPSWVLDDLKPLPGVPEFLWFLPPLLAIPSLTCLRFRQESTLTLLLLLAVCLVASTIPFGKSSVLFSALALAVIAGFILGCAANRYGKRRTGNWRFQLFTFIPLLALALLFLWDYDLKVKESVFRLPLLIPGLLLGSMVLIGWRGLAEFRPSWRQLGYLAITVAAVLTVTAMMVEPYRMHLLNLERAPLSETAAPPAEIGE